MYNTTLLLHYQSTTIPFYCGLQLSEINDLNFIENNSRDCDIGDIRHNLRYGYIHLQVRTQGGIKKRIIRDRCESQTGKVDSTDKIIFLFPLEDRRK